MREEERVGEERRRRLVDEGRHLAHERRTHADVSLFEFADDVRVDVGVADAVRDVVGSRVEQRLGVGEVEEVRGDAQPSLVRLVDDGAIDLGRHLGRRAKVVVDADLDDVHLLIRDAGNLRACFVRRVGRQHRPGEKHASVVERRCRLRRSRREYRRGLATEAEDSRDAVRGVRAEIRPAC